MSQLLRLLFVFAILLGNTPAIASAQSNHSLEWGVEVGDEMIYFIQKKTMDESFGGMFGDYAPFLTEVDEGQKVIARVTHLDTIPDQINSTYDIPSSNCTLIRANDSTVIMEGMQMIVTLSGDWSLRTQLANFTDSDDMDMTLIDTEEEWGTVMSASFLIGIFRVNFNWDMRYFKINGSMSKMGIYVEFGTVMMDILFVKWTPGLETPDTILPIENVLVGVGVSISVAALVVILYKDRKSRVPV